MTTFATNFATDIDWLDGIAMLNIKQELQRVAADPELLFKAIQREIADINAGIGQEAIQLQEVAA